MPPPAAATDLFATFVASRSPAGAWAAAACYLGSRMPDKRARSTREAVDAAIARLAERQEGVVSRAQSARLGATRAMVASRVASGRWLRVHSGVYRLAGAPPSWRGSLIAACLAYGSGAAVSHRAAAALWRFPGFEEPVVELTVPRERGRIPGIIVHRVAPIAKADRTAIGAIVVTTPARTLIDIASIASPNAVEEALDDALRRGLVTIPLLRRRIRDLAVKGRPGIARIRSLLAMREGTVAPMSVLETRVLRLLRRARLPAPVLQYEVRERRRLVAVVDFAFPHARVAIEADGYRWHGSRARWARDLARRNALTALGWQVVHVTWDDLTTRPRETVATIRATLARARTSP